MDHTEVQALRQLIEEDEVKLGRLNEQEITVHGQSGLHDFRAATQYANLLSEAREVEERVQKLAAVTHES